MKTFLIFLKLLGLFANVLCALFLLGIGIVLRNWLNIGAALVWFIVIYFGYLHDFKDTRSLSGRSDNSN